MASTGAIVRFPRCGVRPDLAAYLLAAVPHLRRMQPDAAALVELAVAELDGSAALPIDNLGKTFSRNAAINYLTYAMEDFTTGQKTPAIAVAAALQILTHDKLSEDRAHPEHQSGVGF